MCMDWQRRCYTLLTAEVPVAAVLRDRNPLIPIQQLRPDVSGQMVEAIAQGMNIELQHRPQSVGQWLTMLTEKQSTGFFGRAKQVSKSVPSQYGQSTNGQTIGGRPTMPQPTAVGGYVPPPFRIAYPRLRLRATVRATDHFSRPPTAPTKQATERWPCPVPTTGYPDRSSRPAISTPAAEEASRQRVGLRCHFLGLMMLGILGALGGIGFWAYQQFASELPQMPKLALPEVLSETFPEIRTSGN